MTYRLGTGIGSIFPYHKVTIQQTEVTSVSKPQHQDTKPIFGTKLIILFTIIAIVKIAVLLLL